MAIAASTAVTCSARTARARSGALPTRVWARRRLTTRATRCCWAPSWMSRSRRRRSASWASTSRRRDTWSSSARDGELRGAPRQLGAEPGPVQHHARPGPRDRRTSRSSTGPNGCVVGLAHAAGSRAALRRGRRRATWTPGADARSASVGRAGVRAARWPRSSSSPATTSHTCAQARAGPRGELPGHPGRQVDRSGTGAVARIGQRLGEAAQHVVRRRVARASSRSVTTDRERGPERLEAEGDQRRGEHREPDVRRVGAADQRPTAEHDDDVHGGDGEQRADASRRPRYAGRAPIARASCAAVCSSSRAPRGRGASRRGGVRKTALAVGPSRVSGWPRRRRAPP